MGFWSLRGLIMYECANNFENYFKYMNHNYEKIISRMEESKYGERIKENKDEIIFLEIKERNKKYDYILLILLVLIVISIYYYKFKLPTSNKNYFYF